MFHGFSLELHFHLVFLAKNRRFPTSVSFSLVACRGREEDVMMLVADELGVARQGREPTKGTPKWLHGSANKMVGKLCGPKVPKGENGGESAEVTSLLSADKRNRPRPACTSELKQDSQMHLHDFLKMDVVRWALC